MKPPSDADRLFEEGRGLAKDGKYSEACARFTKSFEIEHVLGTELNLADCEEKLRHLRAVSSVREAGARLVRRVVLAPITSTPPPDGEGCEPEHGERSNAARARTGVASAFDRAGVVEAGIAAAATGRIRWRRI